MLRNFLIALLAFAPAVACATDYRGMPAGWPLTSAGTPAVPVTSGYRPSAGGYALYPANRPSYAPPLAYLAARPVQSASAAYYAPTPGMAPSYSRVNYTQPVTAYYAPQTNPLQAGYAAAPAVTAYMPASNGMAPAYGISPQPGTTMQQQRVYYGTAGSLSFAPPAAPVAYRAYYAPAAGAVTYYRPITVYQPTTGQPITCLQAVQPAYQSCGTANCAPAGCGPSGCSRGWGLFDWLCPRGCGPSGCGSSCAPTGCGQQPYYPVVPVTPVTPVTPTIPVVPAPTTTTPPIIGTPRVPPPPTRILGPTTGSAADTPPSLAPGGLPSTGGTIVTPLPGSTTTPGTTTTPITPAPVSPYQPSQPGTALPATEYYPPSPETNRFAPQDNGASSPPRFSPPSIPATPNGVQIVPDPDAPTFKPANRAPQLINPSDRSAALANPWAVVPAVWPTKQGIVARPVQQDREPNNVGGRVVRATRSSASRQLDERADFTPTSAFVPQADEPLDDSGWSSAR